MRWLLALALALAPVASTNAPGFLDAPSLIRLCNVTGPDAGGARALCIGYVVGVVDRLLMDQSRQEAPKVCLPSGITAEQLVGAVMVHHRWTVSDVPIGASDFIRSALELAYPCPRPAEPK
jgi:hypothetical protein